MFFKIDNSNLVFDERNIQIDGLSPVKIITAKQVGNRIIFTSLQKVFNGIITDTFNSYNDFLENGMMMIYTSNSCETDSTILFKNRYQNNIYWISFRKINNTNSYTVDINDIDDADYLAIYKVDHANPNNPPTPIIIRKF